MSAELRKEYKSLVAIRHEAHINGIVWLAKLMDDLMGNIVQFAHREEQHA